MPCWIKALISYIFFYWPQTFEQYFVLTCFFKHNTYILHIIILLIKYINILNILVDLINKLDLNK